MKNILLFSIFIFAFSTSILAQKDGEKPKLVKGELYHIAVGDLLIPTTDIFSAAEKYEGKIKMILQFKKPKKKTYKISKSLAAIIKNLKPIEIGPQTRSFGLICGCNVSSDWIPVVITVGCNDRGSHQNCESCCAFMKEAMQDFSWREIIDGL